MQLAVQSRPPYVLRMLAHRLRWQIVRALATSDRRVRELADIVGQPYNVVSYHLHQLRKHAIVVERRSSRDARNVYYSLDIDNLRLAYSDSAEAVHPSIAATSADEAMTRLSFGPRPRVLILCTHNSARSQMAEGLLRSVSKGSVDVFSAGSDPSNVNPDAIAAMARLGIDITGQRAKAMNEFAGQGFDYVITVCDSVREVCPVFPGDPERIHWSIPDPSDVENDQQRAHAFDQTAIGLKTRFRHLMALIECDRNIAE